MRYGALISSRRCSVKVALMETEHRPAHSHWRGNRWVSEWTHSELRLTVDVWKWTAAPRIPKKGKNAPAGLGSVPHSSVHKTFHQHCRFHTQPALLHWKDTLVLQRASRTQEEWAKHWSPYRETGGTNYCSVSTTAQQYMSCTSGLWRHLCPQDRQWHRKQAITCLTCSMLYWFPIYYQSVLVSHKKMWGGGCCTLGNALLLFQLRSLVLQLNLSWRRLMLPRGVPEVRRPPNLGR